MLGNTGHGCSTHEHTAIIVIHIRPVQDQVKPTKSVIIPASCNKMDSVGYKKTTGESMKLGRGHRYDPSIYTYMKLSKKKYKVKHTKINIENFINSSA